MKAKELLLWCHKNEVVPRRPDEEERREMEMDCATLTPEIIAALDRYIPKNELPIDMIWLEGASDLTRKAYLSQLKQPYLFDNDWILEAWDEKS